MTYSYLLGMVLVFLFGFLTFFNNRKGLSSRIFFLLSLVIVLWLGFNLLSWVYAAELFWARLTIIGGLIPILFLYFSYIFPDEKPPSHSKTLIPFLLGLPLVALAATKYNVSSIDISTPDCPPEVGWLYYYLLFSVVVATILSFVTLWKKRKHLKERSLRQKIEIPLWGFVFMVSWSLITNVFSQLFDFDILSAFSPFGVLIFSGAIAYTIIKHQFLNTKLVATQLFVAIIWLLIFLQFFFADNWPLRGLIMITFILSVSFGVVLLRSVNNEIRRKEELQEISNRLAAANQELRRLDNAKSEFISIASHQLRTPLTAIKGFVSLLLEGAYGKVVPQVQDTLNKVYLANNRLMLLVENLLNISRIESGRIQYQFAEARVEDILSEIVEMMSLAARQKGLEIKLTLPKSKLPLVTLDAAKIREVFSNLIDNSIKYTPKGSISVTAKTSPGGIQVTVEDTGMGITSEDLNHLFGKFERGGQAARVNVSSTGLGLYVGKSFVEAHGGTITAASEGAGKGARFVVTLPLQQKKSK
ncbi:MAG: ATP-binding protein [Candidatus Moraniibacteriota bacterium]